MSEWHCQCGWSGQGEHSHEVANMSRDKQTGRVTAAISKAYRKRNQCFAEYVGHYHVLPEDGYADGGEPYSHEELALINSCACWKGSA